MATTRIGGVAVLLIASTLCLLAASPVHAQAWVIHPNYGPYYLTYPGPLYPPFAPAVASTPVARTAAYGAAASTDEPRPSYYSEDYSGPEVPTSEPTKLAYIRVRVPAGAELWINGQKGKQAGAVREFVTPALDPDHIYVYNVRARWTEEGGINVEKSLRVRTISGTRVTVNFVRPPAVAPRQIVQAAVAPTPSAPVEQRPVSWSSSAPPRSFTPTGQ